MLGLNSYTVEYLYKELSTKFFFVRVPITATYSEEEIKMLGVHNELTSGGEINDKQTIHEFVKVRLPITRILEIYSTGFRVYISDRNDVKKIIDLLDNLIKNSERGHSIDQTGITDLCDNFMKSVLGHHKVSLKRKVEKEFNDYTDDIIGDGLFLTVNDNQDSEIDLKNIKIDLKDR